MKTKVIYVLFLNLFFNSFSCYEYHDQDDWGDEFPSCSGLRQSPILINTSKTIDEYFPAVEFIGYHNLISKKSYFINNGHTVSLQISNDQPLRPYIFGGKLNGIYEFESFHFHWGFTNDRGSEHIINNVQYAMEMHLVHRNQKYPTMEESYKHPDGLAVVAVLFNVAYHRNPALNTLLDHVGQLKKFNSSIYVHLPLLLSSYLPTNIDKFYTYEGSLTTPPCAESVNWIIFADTVYLSNKQLDVFRNLQMENRKQLVDNYRYLQEINGRPIYTRTLPTRSAIHRLFNFWKY